MQKSIASGLLAAFLVVSMLSAAFFIHPVKATGTIYIRADGSIDPPTAPISTVDNITYTFTDNINESVYMERSNIFVDGAGFNLQGTPSGQGFTLSGIGNVTIKNTIIKGFTIGILLLSSNNITIYGNNITNTVCGIYVGSSSNNTISRNNVAANTDWGIYLSSSNDSRILLNNITSNDKGFGLFNSNMNRIVGNNIAASNAYSFQFWSASSNRVYHNNFVGNAYQISYVGNLGDAWDDGYPSGGNYWSDYLNVDLYSGVYQNETGSDGIGDVIYLIDEYNRDRYPLMNPYVGPYDVAIAAHCNSEEVDMSVSITMDGSPTGYTTPHTFTNLTGTHSFTVPNTDPSDHLFRQWNTGEATSTVVVDVVGTYTAYYDVMHNLTITTTAGGNTNPAPGIYAYWLDASVNVTALPYAYCDLDHWELDRVSIGPSNSIDVTMDKNHVLLAVFKTHDVAIADVKSSKTVVGKGYSLNISVTMANHGNYTETFNLTVLANTTVTATQIVTLTSGNSTTKTFAWKTIGFAKGNYTISAYAEPVSGETYTSDNTFIYGAITVTIPGDVDGNQAVNILDVVKITGIYASKLGDPSFNPNSDINGDGQITILDVVICTSHYGEKYP